jgi:hypothetical protein
MHINKDKSFLLIIFFFLTFVLILQLTSQHWSSKVDQDSVVLYNSLLVANNIQQEYLDHPSYSLFLINGIFLKIANLIGLINIDFITKINSVDDFDKKFQHAFYVIKAVGLVVSFLSIFIFKKIMQQLNFSLKQIIISILFLVTNYYYILSFFSLRSEPIAVLFFLISLYCVFKFNNNQKYHLIIFFSIFMVLSIFAKIQLIISYFFLILFFIVNCDNYKISDIPLFLKKKKFLFSINLFFLIFFLVLIYFVSSSDRYLGLFILEKYFIILICLFFLYFLFINKIRLSNYFLRFNQILFFIFFGIFVSLIIFFLLDFFEFIALNPRVILRLILPIHYLTYFSNIYSLEEISNNLILDLPTFIYFIATIFFGLIYFIKSYNFSNFKEKKLMFFLFAILILSLVSSFFRGFYFYIIIYISIICSNIFLQNKNKIFHLAFVVLFISNIFINFSNFKNLIPLNDKIDLICKNENNIRDHMKYWHQKFDDKFLDKFCLIK